MKALKFIAHKLKQAAVRSETVLFILVVFLMPLIIGIMVWTQLRQGLRVLVAEYREFNPGSSTWK